MDYDIERAKQNEAEIRKAFAEIFPLCNEKDLPWAACHIKGFLRDRIRREVEEGMSWFQHRVVRVLCEISPPKTHVEDMARICVEQAKRAAELEKENKDLLLKREQLKRIADLCTGLLPKAGIATPEKGYFKETGGIGQLESDLERLVGIASEAGHENCG
jgi:hypothetical protein